MNIQRYRPLVGSSLTFLYPYVLGRQIKSKSLRYGYTTILGSILGTSILIHSGIYTQYAHQLLTLDRFFIFLWILWNTHVLRRVKHKRKAIGFALFVLILGANKLYQKSKLLHMLMHMAGSIGTTVLIYQVLDDENKNKFLSTKEGGMTVR